MHSLLKLNPPLKNLGTPLIAHKIFLYTLDSLHNYLMFVFDKDQLYVSRNGVQGLRSRLGGRL